MKTSEIKFLVLGIENKEDKVIVRYALTAKHVAMTLTFDHTKYGNQLEEYRKKHRFKFKKPALTLTYKHGEIIRAKFEQGPEFDRYPEEFKELEKLEEKLLAEFKKGFDAYLNKLQPEPINELRIKAFSLPPLLRYWPLALLNLFEKDPAMLKRISVLLKLLQIVNLRRPHENYEISPFSLRGLTDSMGKLLDGCNYEWDEILLYKHENRPICSMWDSLAENSDVRKQLKDFSLASENEMITSYLDYLTRQMVYTYSRDITVFEKNLSVGGGGLFSPEYRLLSDNDELRKNVKKLYLYRIDSDFLAGNIIPVQDMYGIIQFIQL